MSDKKPECKVKIGIAYEPKWFERRQTSGWYSGKNPPLDRDAMTLQDALLGSRAFTPKKIRGETVCGYMLLIALLAWTTWVMLM